MRQNEREEFIKSIVKDVRDGLARHNIVAHVEGRYKHFFSIFKKMRKKSKTLDEIYDLFAIRVIVDDKNRCYEVMGVLHEMYTPMPGRFKDYIAMPKANRYQSLHTTLMGKIPEGQASEPFEVQIRTREMHKVAEYGIAAHWKYKEGKIGQEVPEGEEAKYAWLREMMNWQRELSDNKELLNYLKTDMDIFQDHIYCFTPKGMVVKLATGANPIDFAYAIHSGVGDKISGAVVNNKHVPINYTLSTGDQVKIITGPNAKPSIEWLKLVKTSQARSKINQWFKRENRAENIQKGRELLEAEAKRVAVMPLADLLGEGRQVGVLDFFHYRDIDTLYATVGYGGIKVVQVINRLYRDYLKAHPLYNPEELLLKIQEEAANQPVKKLNKSGIVVAGMDDPDVRFSKCCSPLPGDDVVAYITRGRGMTLHRSNCVNILNMAESELVRIIPAEWHVQETSASANYHTDLSVRCEDRRDLLEDIWKVIKDMNIVTDYFNVRKASTDAIFDMGVEVSNASHLERLCAKLNQVKSVHDVRRVTV
jgi:GTP pyrophosphokinase